VPAGGSAASPDIDRSIRITKSLLDHLVCWVQATWVSRHEALLDPAEPGMEGSAMPYLRTIRQPRLRWSGPPTT
jgi:hypothetical protein